MGVIKRGILGGFSGKVASVVGTSWKGIAVMKALPLSVANPNTAAQQEQRTKMLYIVRFAKAILSLIIKPLNDRFASGMSGYNLFVQRNIDLFEGANPTPAANLVLSSGNVTALENLDASGSVGAGTVDVTFDDNTGDGDALASDVPYFALYNVSTDEVVGFLGTTRDAGVAGVEMLPGWAAGNVIELWGSFRRADGTKVSNTRYKTFNLIA